MSRRLATAAASTGSDSDDDLPLALPIRINNSKKSVAQHNAATTASVRESLKNWISQEEEELTLKQLAMASASKTDMSGGSAAGASGRANTSIKTGTGSGLAAKSSRTPTNGRNISSTPQKRTDRVPDVSSSTASTAAPLVPFTPTVPNSTARPTLVQLTSPATARKKLENDLFPPSPTEASVPTTSSSSAFSNNIQCRSPPATPELGPNLVSSTPSRSIVPSANSAAIVLKGIVDASGTGSEGSKIDVVADTIEATGAKRKGRLSHSKSYNISESETDEPMPQLDQLSISSIQEDTPRAKRTVSTPRSNRRITITIDLSSDCSDSESDSSSYESDSDYQPDTSSLSPILPPSARSIEKNEKRKKREGRERRGNTAEYWCSDDDDFIDDTVEVDDSSNDEFEDVNLSVSPAEDRNRIQITPEPDFRSVSPAPSFTDPSHNVLTYVPSPAVRPRSITGAAGLRTTMTTQTTETTTAGTTSTTAAPSLVRDVLKKSLVLPTRKPIVIDLTGSSDEGDDGDDDNVEENEEAEAGEQCESESDESEGEESDDDYEEKGDSGSEAESDIDHDGSSDSDIEITSSTRQPISATPSIKTFVKTSTPFRTPVAVAARKATPLSPTHRSSLSLALIRDLDRAVFRKKWIGMKCVNTATGVDDDAAPVGEDRDKREGRGLPGGMQIIWSNTLRRTAGQARKIPYMENGVKLYRYAVELSVKVLDTEDKLRDTLAHELVHIAAWEFATVPKPPPHGADFKLWGARVTKMRPEILVTTCHSYKIVYKFRWRCLTPGCPNIIDPVRHRCGGGCHGRLEEIDVNGFTKVARVQKKTAWDEFRKSTTAEIKASQAGAGLKNVDVFKLVAVRWNEQKKATAEALATQSAIKGIEEQNSLLTAVEGLKL